MHLPKNSEYKKEGPTKWSNPLVQFETGLTIALCSGYVNVLYHAQYSHVSQRLRLRLE